MMIPVIAPLGIEILIVRERSGRGLRRKSDQESSQLPRLQSRILIRRSEKRGIVIDCLRRLSGWRDLLVPAVGRGVVMMARNLVGRDGRNAVVGGMRVKRRGLRGWRLRGRVHDGDRASTSATFSLYLKGRVSNWKERFFRSHFVVCVLIELAYCSGRIDICLRTDGPFENKNAWGGLVCVFVHYLNDLLRRRERQRLNANEMQMQILSEISSQ
jgi:hypothetical protein